MKLSRRKFFGWGAGVGVAATMPHSTKDIPVNEVNFWPSNQVGAIASKKDMEIQKQIDTEYIKKLTRIASGNLTEEELQGRTLKGDYIHRRYWPLKSISEAGKEFVTERRRMENERRDMIQKAKEALARYDQTGVLKHVFGWYLEVERDVRGYD